MRNGGVRGRKGMQRQQTAVGWETLFSTYGDTLNLRMAGERGGEWRGYEKRAEERRKVRGDKRKGKSVDSGERIADRTKSGERRVVRAEANSRASRWGEKREERREESKEQTR